MKNELNSQEELKDAPLLRSLSSSNAFEAPEGYFDELSSQISAKISSKKSVFQTGFLKPVLAGLSLIILLLTIGYFYNQENVDRLESSNEVSSEKLYDNIIESEYYCEFDESLLAESLSENQSKSTLQTPTESELEIENYLIQSADESILTNEL